MITTRMYRALQILSSGALIIVNLGLYKNLALIYTH